MSLSLPKFEMYEEGSQIRRSSKSVSNNIVEGFGRRKYKQEFIRFLTFSLGSCDETIEHLYRRYFWFWFIAKGRLNFAKF